VVLAAARAEAARVLAAARAEAEQVLAAAHTAEATARAAQHAARADADRLVALSIAERLARSQHSPQDRRQTRPVQILIHVPITTALGLSNEPGWLDGYGWINAPQCRQLLPDAELRQVCLSQTGQVVDLAPRTVRPDPTPHGVRDALLAMATQPFDITDAAWHTQAQHDPSDATADLVRIRDRFCDGPTGLLWPAHRSDLDHDHPYPDGPTAAWNLVCRARRTHRLKHHGWGPLRTATDTLWFSPGGQVIRVPHHQQPPPELDPDAYLPDPQALHDLETELLRPPTRDDEPPQPPPF